MIALPAVRYRHASGDDDEGCVSCWIDQADEGLTTSNIRPCTTPEDDPDEPGLCRWCSHTVAPATDGALPCGDCESSDCRCGS